MPHKRSLESQIVHSNRKIPSVEVLSKRVQKALVRYGTARIVYGSFADLSRLNSALLDSVSTRDPGRVFDRLNLLDRLVARVRKRRNAYLHRLAIRKALLTPPPFNKRVTLGNLVIRTQKTHVVSYMPKRTKSRSGSSKVKNTFNMAGLRGARMSDLLLAPVNPTRVPRSVPQNAASQVVWNINKADTSITTQTSPSAVAETNFTFFLGQIGQATQWAALYDMYFIEQAAVTFQGVIPPGESSSNLPSLHTAIDFNAAGNINTIAAMEGFDSHTVDILSPGKSVTRLCKPCLAPNTTGSGSGAFMMSRQWCPTAFNNAVWFGIRSMITGTSVATTVPVQITLWIAFRNGI